MNAHDSTVYSANKSGSCATGMTAITLSDSPGLMFVLLRQANVPLGHCIYRPKGCFEGVSETHLVTRIHTFKRADISANVEPKRVRHIRRWQ